jgi:DNA invertase Pin-like site-specific DNA recombinase
MHVAVYARVSTVRQAQAQTTDQQLDRLHAHAEQQGWTLTAMETGDRRRLTLAYGRTSSDRSGRSRAYLNRMLALGRPSYVRIA